MIRRALTPWLLLLVLLGGCAKHEIRGGKASWYGRELAGNRTASGERFDPGKRTAAHRTLPFGTVVKVTRVSNGKSVRVVINDRGPFVAGRVIDVSERAARKLDMIGAGVARVELQVVGCKERYGRCPDRRR